MVGLVVTKGKCNNANSAAVAQACKTKRILQSGQVRPENERHEASTRYPVERREAGKIDLCKLSLWS